MKPTVYLVRFDRSSPDFEQMAQTLESPIFESDASTEGDTITFDIDCWLMAIFVHEPPEDEHWLARDLEFWLELMNFNIEYIKTAGWPEFPGIRKPGVVQTVKFFATNTSDVHAGVAANVNSAYFGFDIIGGTSEADDKRAITKAAGSTVVFHWFYPYFAGRKEWIDECADRIRKYHQAKGFEVQNILRLEEAEKLFQNLTLEVS